MAGRMKVNSFRPPFGYRPGKTILHRVPAGIKLLCVVVISIALYTSLYGLALSVLLIIAASAAARIRPWELLKGSKPVIILSLCIIIIKTLNQQLPEGLITALSILTSFTAAALLFAVTTMRELRLSLAVVELKLRGKKADLAFFSLGISLMLGFIPRFFEHWENANISCEARSCKRGLRRLFILVPLVTERMMEAAEETALALEARGLGN